MTWAKLDESFPDHPKIAALSDRAFRLHVAAICYCSRVLSDGEIPKAMLPKLGATKTLINELHTAGLWESTSRESWVIHDFLEYNPSRAEVEEERAKRRTAGQAGGRASGKARAQALASANAQASAGDNVGTPTRPVIVPSNEATILPPAPATRRGISEEDICRWEGQNPTLDIRAFVDDYLNWTGSSKHRNKVQGFENQLRIAWKREQFVRATPERRYNREEGIFAGVD